MCPCVHVYGKDRGTMRNQQCKVVSEKHMQNVCSFSSPIGFEKEIKKKTKNKRRVLIFMKTQLVDRPA